MGGEICSPYNDECYESPTETDIEHIIALSEAHDSGLCATTDETKQQFAADLRNLTLAPPALQRYEKSDQRRGRLVARTESLLVRGANRDRAPGL